jgi:hypothetical protein
VSQRGTVAPVLDIGVRAIGGSKRLEKSGDLRDNERRVSEWVDDEGQSEGM